MQKFLIDANLPYHIDIWNSDQFIHVFQLNPEWDDNSIWNYAKQNDLVIVSKDKDFFIKQLLFGAPPKLVQIKYGNLKLKEFIQRIEHVWKLVSQEIEDHSLIIIYKDKIETIK